MQCSGIIPAWNCSAFQETQLVLGHPAMQSGRFVNRLIGMLLVVTLMCPSWLWGNCCCSRRAVARNHAACCPSSPDSGVKTKSTAKPCCAARVAVVKTATPERPDCRPVSPCRCRMPVDSVVVLNSVRTSELTSQIVPIAIPERFAGIPDHDLPCGLASSPSKDPSDPPSPSERCARLCRWLA